MGCLGALHSSCMGGRCSAAKTIFREAMMADEAQVQRLTPPIDLEMGKCPGWSVPGLRHEVVLHVAADNETFTYRNAGTSAQQQVSCTCGRLDVYCCCRANSRSVRRIYSSL